MQNTSPIWKWLWADGKKNLPPADYSGDVVSFDNPGYVYPKQITVDITHVQSGSGWTGVNVTRTGKNLLNVPDRSITYSGNTYTSSNGQIAIQQASNAPTSIGLYSGNVSRYGPRTWDGSTFGGAVFVKAGQTFTLSISISSLGGTPYLGRYLFPYVYYADGTRAEFPYIMGTGLFTLTQTAPSDVVEVFVWLSEMTSQVTMEFTAQLELGSTATAYEPYQGETYDITFPTEAGTVYGGTLDVTNGTLTTLDSIVYQLDPTQIALLAGVNNVWADCGDIVVSLESPRDVKLEAEAIIAGVEYTDISAPVINRALMQNGLTVGNAVACTCSFTVQGAGTIPRSAEVIVKARLTDGTQASEWLSCGTFYVSRRRRDAVTGLVELECYDAMLKANATYEASGAWPRAMADVVTEIAALLGVEIDTRTHINTGGAYMMSLPDAWATINNVLADIATVHGGNWIITPAGKLRLVPVTSASGAASAAEAVEVDGIIGSLTVGATQEVTGIRISSDDGDTLIGTDDGLVVNIDSPYVNETSAADLATMLIGQTYQSYTMTQAVYDPAAELGDYLRGGAEGEVNSLLYGEVATFGTAYRGNLTALEVAEIADEYPYIGGNEAVAEQVRRLSSVVADKASIEDLEAVDARLDNLSASDIKAGIIHSADYETVVIPLIYPASDLYPAADLYPNYGERVIKGFAIDFATGQIYGAFYSTQIEQLQDAVEALQNALVYPKAQTATRSRMELYPYNLASVKTAIEKKEEKDDGDKL